MAPDDSLSLPFEPRPEGVATKRCKRCRKTKSLDEFHWRPEQGRHRTECKDCYRMALTARRDHEDNRRRVKAWRKTNPAKVSEYGRRNHEGRRDNVVRWLASTLKTTRAYCKKRNIECSIMADQLGQMYEAQGGKCALTGRTLLIGSKGQQRDSISIDRIEPGGPYAIGNVRLVTHQANMARGMYSDEELFAFCEAVLKQREAQ